jgi:hypothetical protein
MFKGTKGFIVGDYSNRLLIPSGRDADLTYYKPRDPKDRLPAIGHFQKEWVNACKDPSKKTCCDFDYHTRMIEQMILGLIAYRVGAELQYDGATGKVTNHDEANTLLKRTYREGWALNG